jgi:hypothetical protein
LPRHPATAKDVGPNRAATTKTIFIVQRRTFMVVLFPKQEVSIHAEEHAGADL